MIVTSFLAQLFLKKTTRYCHSSGVVCVVIVVVQKLGHFVISLSLLKMFTWNSDKLFITKRGTHTNRGGKSQNIFGTVMPFSWLRNCSWALAPAGGALVYTPPQDSGGVLWWFHIGCPCVCLSIHQLYICPFILVCFWMITWLNINGFSPNLVCSLKLWRSGLELLMGKFRQIFMFICP